jgi:uncharacterized protein (TIGR01319 family)
MPDSIVISIDIGSTFTKGALFSLEGDALRLLRRTETPTTPGDLALGFEAVRRGLDAEPGTRIYVCSSARGGLKIAALGLTADLTLAVARQAACSAGGKVVRAFAYQLVPDDVAELERLAPDIVLFTGGTDGGHERYTLRNAEALAASTLSSFIIYAGNRKIKDRVLTLLGNKEAVAAENVMPEVGVVNIEPAREVIRRLFLERLIDGKGLSAIVRSIGTPPRPTPLAVYDLVRAIPAARPEWENFGVLDLGGATTDFYSNGEPFFGGDSILLRGLPEPHVKRTVEGDLGLRVSVEALCLSERVFLDRRLAAAGLDAAAFDRYVRSVASRVEAMPETPDERAFDALLAGACVRTAARRHVGTLSRIFKPQGAFLVQRGKDLRPVGRLVGSGGYLARNRDAAVLREACAAPDADPDVRSLVPENPALYADAEYLFPLLGNLVAAFPEAAARTAVDRLVKLS